MGTLTLTNKLVGSPQALVDLEADLQDLIGNVAANASTPATVVTTPAAVIATADATDLASALVLVNTCKSTINTIKAENIVLKSSISALIIQNATFKTTINAQLTAMKASGLQAVS